MKENIAVLMIVLYLSSFALALDYSPDDDISTDNYTEIMIDDVFIELIEAKDGADWIVKLPILVSFILIMLLFIMRVLKR